MVQGSFVVGLWPDGVGWNDGMMEGWEVGRYREIAALRPKIPTFHYSIFKTSVKIISIS
jgi:hypothetical protein